MAPPCATRKANRPSRFRHPSSLHTVSPGRASLSQPPIENAMSNRVFRLGHFSRAEVGQFSRAPKDHAISQAYARLATDAIATATFHELLRCARKRSRRLL